MKKVALMLYGSHRTLFECLSSMRSLLNSSKYEIVPFFYFWDTGDRARNNSIVEFVNPGHFRFGLLPNFDFVMKRLAKTQPLLPETFGPHLNLAKLLEGIYLRCYAMHQVNYVRKEYEYSHDETFDWYWLSRPDLFYKTTNMDLEFEINSSERLYAPWTGKEDILSNLNCLAPIEEYEACVRPDRGPKEFITGEPVTPDKRGLDIYQRPMGLVEPGFKLGDNDNIAVLSYRGHYSFWNDQSAFLTRRSVDTWARQYEWMITDILSGKETWLLWSEMLTKQWNHHVNGTQMVTVPINFDIFRPDDARVSSDYNWVWTKTL